MTKKGVTINLDSVDRGLWWNLDPSKRPWQCWLNSPYDKGGRGYTTWNDGTRQIAPGDYLEYAFTCTRPSYYDAKDNCNVVLNNFTIDSDASTDDVQIRLKCNGQIIHSEFHSKIRGHNTTLMIDLANFPSYNDTGTNYFRIENLDSQRRVLFSTSEIHRVYAMKNLTLQQSAITGTPQAVNQDSESMLGTSVPLTGSDYPCLKHGGGGRSYTFWQDVNSRTIRPNDYLEYHFTCDRPDNYISSKVCLACIDGLGIDSDSAGNDVKFRLLCNSTLLREDYHSRIRGHDIWPGIDLAKYGAYRDTSENVFRIENVDTKTISLRTFAIYRIYQTQTIP